MGLTIHYGATVTGISTIRSLIDSPRNAGPVNSFIMLG